MNKHLLFRLTFSIAFWFYCAGFALAATTAVPDNFATIQLAVTAVQNDLDPGVVIINSNAIFSESVDIHESVTVRAGDGFSPAIERTSGSFAPIRIRAMNDARTDVFIEGIDIRTPLSCDANGIAISNRSTSHPLYITLDDLSVDAAGSKSAVSVASGSINANIYLTLIDSYLQIEGTSVGSPQCVRLTPYAYNINAVLRNNTFRYSNGSGVTINAGRDDKLVSTLIDANVFEGFTSAAGEGDFGISIYGTGSAGSLASPTTTYVTNNLITNTMYSINVNGQSEHTHTIYVNNNTIINSMEDGVALYALGTSTIEARVTNNIIVGSARYGIYKMSPAVGTINLANDYNLMYDNATDNYAGATAGANALVTDPMFTLFSAGNCRLQPQSPAIDSGTNTPSGGLGFGFDLDGNARIQDSNGDTVDVINRGAYEEPQSTPSSSSGGGGGGCFIFTGMQSI